MQLSVYFIGTSAVVRCRDVELESVVSRLSTAIFAGVRIFTPGLRLPVAFRVLRFVRSTFTELNSVSERVYSSGSVRSARTD